VFLSVFEALVTLQIHGARAYRPGTSPRQNQGLYPRPRQTSTRWPLKNLPARRTQKRPESRPSSESQANSPRAPG
jgi:hypothetical protein